MVVFSAHGVAPSVHDNAAARGLRTIDATCPLVTKVHVEARKLRRRGLHDRPDRPRGPRGGRGDDRRGAGAASSWSRPRTTSTSLEVADPGPGRLHHPDHALGRRDQPIIAALQAKFPSVVGPKTDDICYATTNRQIAVKQLARECDLVLVIGSTNSSNSNRLVEVAREHGAASHLIDNHTQVEEEWLEGVETVGITSGASAPEELVERLVDFFRERGAERRLRAADRPRGRPLHASRRDPQGARRLGNLATAHGGSRPQPRGTRAAHRRPCRRGHQADRSGFEAG